MESLYFLIPISLITLGVAVAIFFWAVNSGQYEDMEREGDRILFDEDDNKPAQTGSLPPQQLKPKEAGDD